MQQGKQLASRVKKEQQSTLGIRTLGIHTLQENYFLLSPQQQSYSS